MFHFTMSSLDLFEIAKFAAPLTYSMKHTVAFGKVFGDGIYITRIAELEQ